MDFDCFNTAMRDVKWTDVFDHLVFVKKVTRHVIIDELVVFCSGEVRLIGDICVCRKLDLVRSNATNEHLAPQLANSTIQLLTANTLNKYRVI